MIIGDHGSLTLTAGIVTAMESTDTDNTTSGDDTIDAGSGDNYIIAGGGMDDVTSGAGDDYVTGDHGTMTFTDVGILTQIVTKLDNYGSDDTLSLGDGSNIAIGGQGEDTLTTGTGNDILLGDSGVVNRDTSGVVTDIESSSLDQGGNDTIAAVEGNNYIIAGSGNDTIDTGNGNDNIIGDNGVIEISSGIVTFIDSTDPDDTTTGNDIIEAGDGENYVIAGGGSDSVTSGAGDDYVIGDHGTMTFTDSGILTQITTKLDGLGGDDTLTLGDGNNIAAGGRGKDNITAGAGDDILLGDSGVINRDAAGIITHIKNIDPDQGGNDTITAGSGDDIVIGGIGSDTIDGGSGNDILIGDLGTITMENALPSQIISIPTMLGGEDVISGGDGYDILIGGENKDQLSGGIGTDILIGDNGFVRFTDGKPVTVETRPSIYGDSDFMDGGEGTDVLMGGEGRDIIEGEFPVDVLIGKYGRVIIDDYKVVRVYPPLSYMTGSPISAVKKIGFPDQGVFPGPVRAMFMEAGAEVITSSPVISDSDSFDRNNYYSHVSGYMNTDTGKAKIKTANLADGSIEKTYPNGMIVLIKPDKTVITKSPDGSEKIESPDGSVKLIFPNGLKKIKYPDGSSVTTYPDGRVIKVLPDGTVINSSVENEGAELRLNRLLLQARRDTDGLFDPGEDNDIFANLIKDNNSDRIARKIDVGTLVTGLSGWGVCSSTKSDNERLIDRKSLQALDRKNRLRRFVKWGNGEMEKKAGKELSFLKKKDLN